MDVKFDSEYEPSDELNCLIESSEAEGDSDDFPEFTKERDMKASYLKKWMKFADPREFRDALPLHSAQHGYDYEHLKNEWVRDRAKCVNIDICWWICHA